MSAQLLIGLVFVALIVFAYGAHALTAAVLADWRRRVEADLGCR